MNTSVSTAHPAHASAHGTPRRALVIYVLLILATLLTWSIGGRGAEGPDVALVLLAIAFVKGSMIALDYMALRRAPLMWPIIVLGWMVVVCAVIAIAYWKGLSA